VEVRHLRKRLRAHWSVSAAALVDIRHCRNCV
jgi:hypothetical protein